VRNNLQKFLTVKHVCLCNRETLLSNKIIKSLIITRHLYSLAQKSKPTPSTKSFQLFFLITSKSRFIQKPCTVSTKFCIILRKILQAHCVHSGFSENINFKQI